VSLVKISKKLKKTANHAGVRYVNKVLVQGIQFRVVPVSLSGHWHKTMMYTLKVWSTIFTNSKRHDRGLDFHFITNSIDDIYTPSSTVKDGDYRVVEIRILKMVGKKNQNYKHISEREKSCGETHTTYTETRNVCTKPNPLAVNSS